MKKQIVRALGYSAGSLAALLLSLTLLGMETQVAAAQGIEQQAPMTDTMPMDDTMPGMPGMPGMSGMGDMGDMAHMMEMMQGMEARMEKMEARMAQMQGSMP